MFLPGSAGSLDVSAALVASRDGTASRGGTPDIRPTCPPFLPKNVPGVVFVKTRLTSQRPRCVVTDDPDSDHGPCRSWDADGRWVRFSPPVRLYRLDPKDRSVPQRSVCTRVVSAGAP